MSFLKSTFFKLPKSKQFDYKPIYFDEEAEKRKKQKNLKLERGSFYKGNNASAISDAFSQKEFAFRGRANKGAQFMRTALLTMMMFAIFAYFIGKLPSYIAIGIVLLGLIVFVKNVNTTS